MARRNPLRTPEGAWYRNYVDCRIPSRVNSPPYFSGADFQQNSYDHTNTNPKDNPPLYDPYHDDHRAVRYYAENERERKHYPWATMAEYRERNGGGMGSRPSLYDPHHHHHAQHDHQHNHPLYEREERHGREEDERREEQGEAKGAFTLRDGHNRNGLGDKEWEPPEDFSPRKTTTYEPSFHHIPAASQKKIPPWERDRVDRRSPDGHGHYLAEDPNHGQGPMQGFDPRLCRHEDLPKQVFSKEAGGAFLFIRFPQSRGEYHHVTAKACLHAQTSDLKGRFFGISKRVFDFGYTSGPEEGCVVFQFPNLRNAEVFFHRDKKFRQPDFPAPHGHAEIFGITLQYDPNTLQTFDTFLMSEVTLNDGMSEESMRDYMTHFKEPFTALLNEPQFKALPFAAFCQYPEERKSLRRRFFAPRTLIVLHLFQRPENLEELMRDRRYSELRCCHNAIATERCSIFTVERQPCP